MLGNYYGESKREPGPIDPVESEIIEKVVMMQQQPTKEEVEKMKRRLARNGLDCVLPNEVESLADAYLALRKDREKLDEYIVGLVRENVDLRADNQALKDEHGRLKDKLSLHMKNAADAIAEIEADNEALRAKANCAVQRFVRGEDTACLVCGKREPCQESPEACTFDPTPMELIRQVKQLQVESRALRARLGNNILEA